MRVAAPFPAGFSTQTRRDIFELVVGYALVIAALWSPPPWTQILFYLGLAWVALVTVLSSPNLRDLGLKLSRIKRDYWVLIVSAGIAGLAALLAVRYGTLHVPLGNKTADWRAGGYILWAFVQQFILQNYFLVRLLRLLPSKSAAVVAAAALFSSAHIPNPLLMIATLVWGAVACMLFLRYRDLYTLGVVHAIFGLCIAFTVPNAVHHRMRVGLGYLRYHPPALQRSQSNHIVSTKEWVMADAKMRCCERQALP